MDAIEAIMTRRSTRKFTAEPVSEEDLKIIIEAGRAAPCGGNNQSCHFIVITDEKVLEELSLLAREEFAKWDVTPGMYPSKKTSVVLSKKGTYVFHYHAPVLIAVANKKGYGNDMADSAIATENMMIAANELDLGSCYINQLYWLTENPKIREYMEKIGLGKDENIMATLALGHSALEGGLPNRKPRHTIGNPVTWVK